MEHTEVEFFVCAWWDGWCGCCCHGVGRIGRVGVVVGGEVVRRLTGVRIAIAVFGRHRGDLLEVSQQWLHVLRGGRSLVVELPWIWQEPDVMSFLAFVPTPKHHPG